jgi:hypothetical protein
MNKRENCSWPPAVSQLAKPVDRELKKKKKAKVACKQELIGDIGWPVVPPMSPSVAIHCISAKKLC